MYCVYHGQISNPGHQRPRAECAHDPEEREHSTEPCHSLLCNSRQDRPLSEAASSSEEKGSTSSSRTFPRLAFERVTPVQPEMETYGDGREPGVGGLRESMREQGWKNREESPAGEPQEGSLRASQLQRVSCRRPYS